MANSPSRHERTVVIADHLWQCVELMAREMGSERDALIGQALFQFARHNGYLAPGQAESTPPEPAPRKREKTGPTPTPATGKHKRETTGVKKRPSAPPPPLATLDDEPTARPASRLTEVDDEMLGAESFRLFDDAEPPSAVRASPFGPPPLPSDKAKAKEKEKDHLKLYLVGQHGELGRVDKSRYIIGRGKHCDLVIHSGKVSREHAAIVQDAGKFVIEDLGSSNGTWFQKKRISRHKIVDGDEFYICSEKIKCVLKA